MLIFQGEYCSNGLKPPATFGLFIIFFFFWGGGGSSRTYCVQAILGILFLWQLEGYILYMCFGACSKLNDIPIPSVYRIFT